MKVNHAEILVNLLPLLQGGISVRDASLQLGVSYSLSCKILREYSLTSKGRFKSRLDINPELISFFKSYILKNESHIKDITAKYGISASQVQNILAKGAIKPCWDLTEKRDKNVIVGRRAELFVESLFQGRILKDSAKYDNKAPYDFILRSSGVDSYSGGIDVKTTKLRVESSGNHRFKWNIDNSRMKTKAQIKYLALLGMDSEYKNPLVLFLIPLNVVKGHSSISISFEHWSESKYSQYIYKTWKLPESDVLSYSSRSSQPFMASQE